MLSKNAPEIAKYTAARQTDENVIVPPQNMQAGGDG
jgi:hypothetical protein